MYVVVRTVDRKTNATGKHALLGPAPVKLSMCWVLSECNGYCSNERNGIAFWVRGGIGSEDGPYIVDGRLVVWNILGHNLTVSSLVGKIIVWGGVVVEDVEFIGFLVDSTYNQHCTLPCIDCHRSDTLYFSVHRSPPMCSLIVEFGFVWWTTLHGVVHTLINMCHYAIWSFALV